MSRSGYVEGDDWDEWDVLRLNGWRANVRRLLAGRAGQKFLWELYLSLEALPARELITEVLEDDAGGCCALGAVARQRALDVPQALRGREEDAEEYYDVPDIAADLLDIKRMLAQEVMYLNDDGGRLHPTGTMERHSYGPRGAYWYSEIMRTETASERWDRMRRWAVSHLRNIP